MAEISRGAKPWNEVVSQVEEFDDVIVQGSTDKIAKKITKDKFKDALAIDIAGISLMEGGTLASPTVLPAPSGTSGDKVYKAGTGFYSYGGNTFEAPQGKDWYLLDNGTSWSLKDMGALPISPTTGDKQPGNTQATSGDTMYYKNADRFTQELILALKTGLSADVLVKSQDGYIDGTGAFVPLGAGNTFKAYDFVDVNEGDEIFIQYDSYSATGNPRGMWGYTLAGVAVSQLVGSVDNSTNGITITIPAGSGIRKIRGTYSTLKSFVIKRKNVTIPMSSVKDLNSLLQKLTPQTITIVNGYINDAGNLTDNVPTSNWRTSDFIDVDNITEYGAEGNTSLGGAAVLVTGYDNEGVKISTIQKTWNSTTQGVFKFKNTNVNIKKVRISSHNSVSLKFYKVEPIQGTDISKAIAVEGTVTNIQSNGGWKMSIIWGAIGHSIWWQDGQPYASSGLISKGIQTWLREKIQFNGYKRYCYSGNSLGMVATDDPSSILQSTKIATWESCDVYTYDSITNDYKRNVPLGTSADFINDTGATTYYGALRKLHNKLFSLNNKYRMIAGNALPRFTVGWTSWDANALGHTLADYSVALEWVCNRVGWKFINQFRDAGFNEFNIDQVTYDKLHPNDFGYTFIYPLWLEEFKKI